MSEMPDTPFHTLMERCDDTPLTDAYDQAHGDPLTDETRYMCMVDWARSLERRLADTERARERAYMNGFESGSKHSKSGTNELIAKLYECRRMVGNMCSEGRPPKMSIPARPEVDEDLVICRTISEAIVALGGTVEPPGGRNNATAAPRGGERHEGEGIARVDGARAVETAAMQTDGEKPPCGSNFESKPGGEKVVAFGAQHCGDPLCDLCCPDDLIQPPSAGSES